MNGAADAWEDRPGGAAITTLAFYRSYTNRRRIDPVEGN